MKKKSVPSKLPVESPASTDDASDALRERSTAVSFPIVGVGASAGGLEAFTQLLRALPLDTGMGFVLVQHLDPEHESALTQILSRATSLPVCDVTNNQTVQPNCVYIIPPDTNLSIVAGVLKLQPRPKTRTPHRPIDSFFESLALDHRERAIGVVLSGTASDGTLGLEAIKAEGGITFAQNDSAKYDSMPRSAVAAGCVDLVLSPKNIAQELARIAKHPYVAGQPLALSIRAADDHADAIELENMDSPLPVSKKGAASKGANGEDAGYIKTLSLLRSHSGVDFSLYKSSTIQRRITRRLVINKQNTLEDYATFLHGNARELDALCTDVLISVTSFNVLKMAREGLMLPLRAAINDAKKENKTTRRDNVRVKQNGETRAVNLEIIPLKNLPELCFLILFEQASGGCQPPESASLPQTRKSDRKQTRGVDTPRSPEGTEAKRITELETDLSETRDCLQTLQEQHEASSEELQAASEEVQSANEELQSINEELETSKEELESANEELTTVNDEMSHRNSELSILNNDLVNFQNSTRLVVLLLGRDLTIRRFSPQAEKQFDLLATDVGRPISHIRHNLVHADDAKTPLDLEALCAEVITSVTEKEREVLDKAGRWHSLRVRPYTTLDKRVDGAVLLLLEIDELKHSEQAVAIARDYAENIVETMRDPLLVLDSSLRIESANRSFYRAFRVEPVDTIGKFIYDLGDKQWHIPRLRELLEKILPRSNSIEEFQVEHDFKELGRRTMLLNARRIVDPRQKTERILLAIEDITGRKRLEKKLNASEILYRRLFETAKDGVLILDANSGRILEANPFMTELSGYPTVEFIGKELWEIGLFRDKPANETAFRELQQKGYVRYDHLPLKSRSEQPVEVEFVSNVYQWDHRQVAQCNIRDISDRSRLEKQTQKQESELSELHRRKDEFLAMLSHELRSPLAPIVNAVELLGLQRGSETLIQQQARSIIERQMGHLQHLVDDLLEVSRITTGRVQLRRVPVTVRDIAEGAVETVRPLIEQRRHELTVSLPPEPIWLQADTARMEQVLVNLLTNAAKYTAEGGHVWLTVELDVAGTLRVPSPATDGTRSVPATEVIIRVRDTGVGISPELLPHVFDLFTQAERSLDRSQGGLGIGLALVHRLTDLHGGTVEAHSTPGQGSEFIVRLPVAPSDTPHPTSPVSETRQPTSRPLRVLVVDDNVDTVLSFSMLLLASGHDVRTAHDGPTAVQVALEYHPDAVLLDIGLPGLNGYQVAERTRREQFLKNVVLVALTGYGQEADRQAALEAGFDHHLVKPARLEQLQRILATVDVSGMTPAPGTKPEGSVLKLGDSSPDRDGRL